MLRRTLEPQGPAGVSLQGAATALGGRNGIETWSAYAGPFGCSIATAAAQNPIVFQHGELDTCYERVAVHGKTEQQLRDELEQVRDSLRGRFAPFRTRMQSDVADADIKRDMTRHLKATPAAAGEASAADRAEALRAWREAWWIDPAGRWS